MSPAKGKYISSYAKLDLTKPIKAGAPQWDLALRFVRAGERHLTREQQVRIGARRLKQFAQAVETVHKKLGYSEKETVQLLAGVVKMRKGEAGAMSVPGRALPRVEKVLKEFERGRAPEPVKSEAARLRRRAGLSAARVTRKAKPAPAPERR